MQQVFHMTAQGVLKDVISGIRYEPTGWPGRIVALCPLCAADAHGEFEYLVIIELDAVPRPAPSLDILKALKGAARPLPSGRRNMVTTPHGMTLTAQRASRVWFRCWRVDASL